MAPARSLLRCSLWALAACLAAPAYADAPADAPVRIPLGSATSAQLAALDGVGDDAAAAIVELRDARGGLRNVEELRILTEVDATALDSLRRHTSLEVELSVGAQGRFSSADEVLARFAHEPTVQQVQGWAATYAKVNPELVGRWMRQSRSFAALPQLTLEYRLRDRFDQDFFYVNPDGEPPSNPNQDAFAVLRDAARDQEGAYTVRARWDLDQLVMSSERIRVINEAQDVVKLRDRVLSEVTRLYFDRRRVQVDRLLGEPSDVARQVEAQLREMELTAQIDALTGGAFSAGLTPDGASGRRGG